MIESDHFYQGFSDFEQFFYFFNDIRFDQALELAKLDNETGEFNACRITFWTKVWWHYIDLTLRI